ncbi:MAG: ABC-F family ATP-binding cassette domain-containing protein [Clostridiaceae bacterium]|nr:ABC-F family ATP-binding cassette domain-containing protein [Clostridiaceae bacterium]
MNILSAEKISKSYSEKLLFNEISLSISEGEKIGLIGINGTGKSTLLKVIAGHEAADCGRIIYTNGIAVNFLPQNPYFEEGTAVLEQVFKGSSPIMKLLREYENALLNFENNPDNSLIENELAALTRKMDALDAWSFETEAKNVLTRLGITDFQADVAKLSGGQRKRVAMASALITPSDLLILDEPTNHIDNDTVDWLEKYLNRRKGALLMVVHDRYFLDRVVNRIIELDGGRLYSYTANYSKYLEMKAQREEIEEASERKRQGLIRRELEWIRRGAQARSTKQKARIDRFEKLTEEDGPKEKEKVEIQTGFSRLGRKIIEIENVSKSYPGKDLIKDFSYILQRDDRIGIIGPNGSGKSTLIKIAAGRLEPDTGNVTIGETVKIGFFSQENEDMNESLRVIEYIKEQAEFLTTSEGVISASQMLERFLFPPAVQWTPISKLSGGEKRRLYLLRILMGAPNVLMLDEPTNDLDIQTLTILEAYLDEFQGAVVAVSHDRYFLDRVVDRIFSFEGKGVVSRYEGNYNDYIQCVQRRERIPEDSSLKTPCNGVKVGTENKKDRPQKFSYKEQKEFEQIDGIIAGLEKEISKVTVQLEEAASDYERLQKLTLEKEQLEKQLEEAMERWVYLNELAEEIERNKKGE